MWQMANVGPMLGQTHHFRMYAQEVLKKDYSPEEVEIRTRYGVDRYTNEAKRLYAVLDRRLGEAEYLAGADYTIADIATYPWLRYWEMQGVNLPDYKNVQRWFDAIGARPAVQRGLEVLAERKLKGPITDAQREILFGTTQYERR
jgi:GST-like protein